VKTGQIVKVKVLSVDAKVKRIALSIKQLEAPSIKQIMKMQKEKPDPEPTMHEKLSALSAKWNVR
jgi:uncharacterized protein